MPYDLKELIRDPSKGQSLKVQELVDLLTNANDKYYNSGSELMPDATYDALRDILTKKSPKNKFLKQIGAPVSKEKVKLPYMMASLNKIKPGTSDLDSWIKKYKGPYYISDKLDGVSGLLHNDGKLKLYTRGDGMYGQDISHLLKYIKVPNIPNGYAVRGELIISKKKFEKINKDKIYKNPRNAIASLANSKTIPIQLAKESEFIAYSVIHPELKFSDQIKELGKLKFTVVTNKMITDLNSDMLSSYFIDRRKNSDYEVDGIVVIDNAIQQVPDSLKNPDHAFAFKMQLDDQTAQVKVIGVEWECSKWGYIKPRVRIEPVSLVGVTITYATAFNAKFVVENNIGPGAIIEVVRSGDVIPDIKKVITAAAKPDLPNMKYTWTSTNVDIIADKSDKVCNRIINIKRASSFFTIIGVKHMSEGIITKLVDNGYDDIFKIIIAFKNKVILYKIDGLGSKIVDKISTNIMNCLNSLTFEKLMAGSHIFGRGFGQRRSKTILKKYPDVLNTVFTKEMIVDIDSFDSITADQFIQNLSEFKIFYNKLKSLHDISYLETKKVTKSSDIFKDKKIVLTGFRNKEIEEFIENNSGAVTTSVSKNTSLVIFTDITSSKYLKAIELKVPTIDLTTFKKTYNLN